MWVGAQVTVAAELEGRTIDLARVHVAAAELARRHGCLIVEGIGGIMVPIAAGRLVADLAAEFGAPLLVGARAALGTINHSLLTVQYARSRGLDVAAVVLNACTDAPFGAAERTNRGVIADLLGGCPVLGPLPYCPGVSVEDGELADLAERLAALDGIGRLIETCLGR